MISMVIDSDYQCVCISDLPPVYKHNGRVASEYSGCNAFDHICEGKDAWKMAIDQCLATQEDRTCEFCNEFDGVVSRWRAMMRYVEVGRVLVTIHSVPYAIHKLSSRERDVLAEVALGKTNSQVAGSLGISLSTVEKHRSHIRQTLNLSTEQELQLTAWIVANPDIFNDLR